MNYPIILARNLTKNPPKPLFLWTKRLKTALCPQNTPFLWMNRSKSELSPQNRAFSWSNLPNTALSSSKHPLFVDESAVSLPVGRLQSVQSAFLGAIRDENWCFTPECLSSSTFPGLKFQFSSRTALFKPLGPARANLRFAAWFSEPKVCRTIFKFALIIV